LHPQPYLKKRNMKKDIDKITRSNNILELKKTLDEFYIGLDLNQKKEAIEYIKYSTIPNYKSGLAYQEKYFDGHNHSLIITWNEAYKRNIEFLKEWVLEKEKGFIQSESTKDEIEPSLDLSNTNGIEKIIYLEKLGILDFLRDKEPFKSSTNRLATAISAITGIPKGTAQPYLNPIVSPGAKQKNNPLNSIKKVEKIEHTLIKIGFKPLK